jgi:hypothetical protein
MNYKILLIFTLLLILRCSEDNNPIINLSQYKEYAHGYWEAASGDTQVTNEIGLIVYNWYAIDTKSNNDSIYVTWDDGIACTKTIATINENKIELSVKDIYAKFTIVSSKNASVIFTTNENQYEKQLIKTRDNPLVLCD